MSVLRATPNTVREYYKYSIQSWTQPTLTCNGEVVDNFSAINYYHAFLPNTTYGTIYRDESRAWFELYMHSPLGIVPKSFSFYVQNRTDASSPAYNIKFYGTNEDWVMNTLISSGASNSGRNNVNTGAWAEAWDIVGTSGNVGENKTGTIDMSTNTKLYRWFRFECSTNGSAYNDRLTIKNFNLTGEQRVIVSGTANDYDFYVDRPLRSISYANYGTKASSNYKEETFFRPTVISDTITYKEDANYLYYTNSSNGNIEVKGTSYGVDTAKAFNPTLGAKRVRPLSATFTSTTVSSQWNSNCCILGWYGNNAGQYWTTTLYTHSTTFNGATKGTYNVTWNNAPFQYWWTFTPRGTGWSSSTQTLAGTIKNIVWEVENNSSSVPDIRYYAL